MYKVSFQLVGSGGARAGILTEGAQCPQSPQSPTPSLPGNAPGTQASNVELSLGRCGLREEEIIENPILSESKFTKFDQINSEIFAVPIHFM